MANGPDRRTLTTPSRRQFIGLAVGSTVAVLATGVDSASAGSEPAEQPAPTSFELRAAPDVDVFVGAGERFDVRVLDSDGEIVADYAALDVAGLLALDSPWFDAVAVEPPAAA